MYTQAELHALTAPLSNEARVLYCLGLRPGVNDTTGTTTALNYKQLLTLVNGETLQPDQRTFSLGRQINRLLKALENVGLVALPAHLTFEQSLNNQVIMLPLTRVEQDRFEQLHQQHKAMTLNWRPHQELYEEMASLLGIIDAGYSEDELGEFIAYWLGRPQSLFSLFQWTQKFANAMKRKRTALGMQPVKKVGTQQVSVAPAVEADDNARKLVEKYSSQHKQP